MDSNNFSKFSRKILEYSHNFIFNFFGISGLNLYNFINKVNSNHPDLDYLINEDHKLFCELLQLCKYLKNKKLNRAQKFIIKNIQEYNFDFSQTSLPGKSKRYARFLPDKEKIRLSKKNYRFYSKSFNKNISRLICEIPNDLELFKKNKNYTAAVEDLKKKKQRYDDLKCNELSNSISKTIELLEQKDHHGYRRMPIAVAACFAAKINGIPVDENYQPAIYPFLELEKFSSLETAKNIEEAENKGFAYFDHYLIVAPSFKNYDKNKDLKIFIDRTLKSLVLGEKDGLCYFICLW